jgi:hypothetical protein
MFEMTENKKNFFLYVIFIFYLSFSFWFLQFHEMWRDELQSWLISRDSHSIVDLFKNLKYEGHPGLWHFLLYLLNKISTNPKIMQIIHVLIASLSVFILIRWAPFTFLQKILLTFSYFLFFEYNLIARNYAVGVLLIFIFCIYFPIRHKKPIATSLILFLLSHTSIFGIIFVISFTFIILFEDLIIKNYRDSKKNFSIKYIIAFTIIVLGILTSLLQIIPPSDSGFAKGWKFYIDLESFKVVGNVFIKSYIPIPPLDINFWNKSIFITNNSLAEANLLILLITTFIILFFIIVITLHLSSKPSALVFFLLTTLLLILFFIVKYQGASRHHGFLFITLIVSLWIYKSCVQKQLFLFKNFSKFFTKNFVQNFIIFILSLHVIASLVPFYIDYKNPFSGAKETAEFIKKNKLDNYNLVGFEDYAAQAVAGYLQNKEIYYLSGERFGTFLKFDNKRKITTSLENKIFTTYQDKNKINTLYILNKPIESKYLVEIFHSKHSIVDSENFYIYRYLD